MPKKRSKFRDSRDFLLVTCASTSSFPHRTLAMMPKDKMVEPELASAILRVAALGSSRSMCKAECLVRLVESKFPFCFHTKF